MQRGVDEAFVPKLQPAPFLRSKWQNCRGYGNKKSGS